MPHASQKILIVDDDETIRRLLKQLLQSQYELAEAATGQQALEVLPGFLPDLVLLDIMLPGIDGYEICRRIKASRSGVQVVMLSAMSSAGQQLRRLRPAPTITLSSRLIRRTCVPGCGCISSCGKPRPVRRQSAPKLNPTTPNFENWQNNTLGTSSPSRTRPCSRWPRSPSRATRKRAVI